MHWLHKLLRSPYGPIQGFLAVVFTMAFAATLAVDITCSPWWSRDALLVAGYLVVTAGFRPRHIGRWYWYAWMFIAAGMLVWALHDLPERRDARRSYCQDLAHQQPPPELWQIKRCPVEWLR